MELSDNANKLLQWLTRYKHTGTQYKAYLEKNNTPSKNILLDSLDEIIKWEQQDIDISNISISDLSLSEVEISLSEVKIVQPIVINNSQVVGVLTPEEVAALPVIAKAPKEIKKGVMKRANEKKIKQESKTKKNQE
jgi:hypothetical protein